MFSAYIETHKQSWGAQTMRDYFDEFSEVMSQESQARAIVERTEREDLRKRQIEDDAQAAGEREQTIIDNERERQGALAQQTANEFALSQTIFEQKRDEFFDIMREQQKYPSERDQIEAEESAIQMSILQDFEREDALNDGNTIIPPTQIETIQDTQTRKLSQHFIF